MLNRERKFPAQLALSLLLMLVLAAVPAAASISPERQLFDLVNQERVREGLAPLAWNDGLAAAAERHAQQMARHREVSHQVRGEQNLRDRLASVPLQHSGENVALNATVLGAHEALMNSPHHRENILDPKFDAIGIGMVQDGQMLWVVQDFAQRMEEESPQDAAGQIATAFARARAQAGLSALTFTDDGRLEALACEAAHKGRFDMEKALRVPYVRNVSAYTSPSPEKLPAEALRLRLERDVVRYGVGVCNARSKEYPSGTYWVLLALYGP